MFGTLCFALRAMGRKPTYPLADANRKDVSPAGLKMQV